MKLVSGVSLIVSVALFAQAWAATPDSQPNSAEQAATKVAPEKAAPEKAAPEKAGPEETAPEKATKAPEAKAEKKPAIRWQSDLKIAHELSLELNRPMLIVFDADWCSYCRKMERTTLAEPQLIAKINRDFVPVHLDLDENASVAEILEVKRIPCTVALSPRADLLGRLTGYVSLKQYGDSLGRVLDLHKKVDKQVVSAAE